MIRGIDLFGHPINQRSALRTSVTVAFGSVTKLGGNRTPALGRKPVSQPRLGGWNASQGAQDAARTIPGTQACAGANSAAVHCIDAVPMAQQSR